LGVVAGDDPAHTPDHATASLAAILLRAFTPASGESLKSQSSFRLPAGRPTFFASASLIFLYLAMSEFFTANTASPSRYGSPSTNTCVITCWKPGAETMACMCAGRMWWL